MIVPVPFRLIDCRPIALSAVQAVQLGVAPERRNGRKKTNGINCTSGVSNLSNPFSD